MINTLGTCSLCAGPVREYWEKVQTEALERVVRCDDCGATPKLPFGNVIEMEAK